MELNKTYQPHEVEKKWYDYWLEKGYFRSIPDEREPYTIVIPPPNVTGVLHMGHMLNNTLQDVLIRKARMEGKNALWVPGTDHASIATEAKVVQLLREQGIKKSDLSREQFLQHAWQWKEKYGGIILEQLKKIGASCDWERTRFTMEKKMNDAVTEVFIDLYNKGLIYRGKRMVNWDPKGKTALSDEEVLHKESTSQLYFVRYFLADAQGKENRNSFVEIATTRPETIFADTALCVHPDDPKYQDQLGKKFIVPLTQRSISLLSDNYIDKEFGTGCLKVTPAHDINDYELGIKYNLPIIDLLNEDGTLNEHGIQYAGMDRFEARKKIVEDLATSGYLSKTEIYKNQIGISERTGAVIEPRLSLQWFVDMKQFLKKNPQVLDAVMNDEIKFHPKKFKNTYRHWLENIKDWCISRQLWWGQRIPAWYDEAQNFVVAADLDTALALYRQKYGKAPQTNLIQDEDVLDTWFSSWLWPITVFDGFENKNNEDINYYYPTQDLVTAPEIMFFWVARMIMAGYEWRGKKPFENVYYTGIVRDKQGRKMSKSLGNSPDPLQLIEKYGADGVRVGMLLCSPAGNDLPFDEKLCEQGRNFCNKIWNAFRLIHGWTEDPAIADANLPAIHWMESQIEKKRIEIQQAFLEYRISEALMLIYKLIWDDFCAWYLEIIKPDFGLPCDKYTYSRTLAIFEKILQIAHPFIPFITEEIWHHLKTRDDKEAIIISQLPEPFDFSPDILIQMELLKEIVVKIREIRSKEQLKPKELIHLYADIHLEKTLDHLIPYLKKLTQTETIQFTTQEIENTHSFVVKQFTLQVDTLKSKPTDISLEEIEKEIKYTKGFIQSVEKKLANERFIANAKPEIIQNEKNKLEDGKAKLKHWEDLMAQVIKK